MKLHQNNELGPFFGLNASAEAWLGLITPLKAFVQFEVLE